MNNTDKIFGFNYDKRIWYKLVENVLNTLLIYALKAAVPHRPKVARQSNVNKMRPFKIKSETHFYKERLKKILPRNIEQLLCCHLHYQNPCFCYKIHSHSRK